MVVLPGRDPESVGLGHRREIQADDPSANDHRAGDALKSPHRLSSRQTRLARQTVAHDPANLTADAACRPGARTHAILFRMRLKKGRERSSRFLLKLAAPIRSTLPSSRRRTSSAVARRGRCCFCLEAVVIPCRIAATAAPPERALRSPLPLTVGERAERLRHSWASSPSRSAGGANRGH